MSLTEVALRLNQWFAENNIATDSISIIINIAETQPAAAVDAALRTYFNRGPLDLSKGFKLAGVNFHIESPLHEESHKYVLRSMKFPPYLTR